MFCLEKNTILRKPSSTRSTNNSTSPSFRISNSNDRQESEAEETAERVMKDGYPASEHLIKGGNNLENLHKNKHPAQVINNRNVYSEGSGKKLDTSVRSFMENRFGMDFSRVKIHNDADAAKLSGYLNAEAFTIGNDIYFNQGKYAPDTSSGNHLLAHELTHTIQQDNSTGSVPTIQRQEDTSIGPRLRIPVLETLAMQYGDLGGLKYPLSSGEINLAKTVFGDSILYSLVNIVQTNFISAPTTLGNNIRIPPGYSLPDHVLIHELTHIWQYQNKGAGYISDSLSHQFVGIISTGDRSAAYSFQIVPNKNFDEYTAEQQAMIVETYFLQDSKEPEYTRLIEQVRRSRPTLTDTDRYMESLYGPGSQNPNLFDRSDIPLGDSRTRGADTFPLFRIEY